MLHINLVILYMYRKGKISYEAGRINLKEEETKVSDYVCMHMCVCASIRAYEYMGITYVHMYIYEYMYMHVYVYVHVYI